MSSPQRELKSWPPGNNINRNMESGGTGVVAYDKEALDMCRDW